jgi:hypothetical protein
VTNIPGGAPYSALLVVVVVVVDEGDIGLVDDAYDTNFDDDAIEVGIVLGTFDNVASAATVDGSISVTL